jgi:hypothetical protein
LTEAAAAQLITDFFNSFQGSPLEPSAIIQLLFQNGATSVSPFSVTITIDRPDGTLQVITDDDSIPLPRGIFLEGDNVTATFK